METPNTDAPEVLETQETDETTVSQPEENAEDRLARLEQEKADLESKNKQLFERAKKAEEAKKTDTAPSQDLAITPKDYLALTEHKVSAEDFDEVAEFARFKGISVAEALKQPVMKTILTEKAEERRTAQATATKSGRGTTKPNDDDLMRRASSGESLGEDSIAALAKARHARNFKK